MDTKSSNVWLVALALAAAGLFLLVVSTGAAVLLHSRPSWRDEGAGLGLYIGSILASLGLLINLVAHIIW